MTFFCLIQAFSIAAVSCRLSKSLQSGNGMFLMIYFSPRVFGTSMVEEYEEIADPPERPDDPDDVLGEN